MKAARVAVRMGTAAMACAVLASPARADPISAAIVTAIGLSGAGAAIATAVITLALTTVGSLLASKLLSPKAKAQDRQASVVSLSIGEGPREALFGEIGTGGSLADAFNFGGSDGTDWEVLIVVVADHRCHSLTGFYVNDIYVVFAGNGPVAGYSGQLEVYWMDGTEGQVMPSIVTTYGGWDANSNLAGCATVVVAYKADGPKAKNPIWTAGRPGFLWVVKGKFCYIARLDDTVTGGAGDHRWDDPATWEWTDNLIDCRYNWQRGIYACDRVDEPGMLLVGRGLSIVEAPPERTIAAANICDENVGLAGGGTENRYRCNIVIRADEEFIATEEMFAAACGGVIVQREGGVEIEPGAAKSVVAEITDSDLIIGERVTFNRFKSDTQRVNSVVPRYIEPSQKYADHAAPIRRSLTDIIADGGPREETLSLVAVTSGTQAQRCGEIGRRMARKERTGGFVLGPRFAHLEDGDWIGWTSNRHLQGGRVVFRITGYSLPSSWRNNITIEEIAGTCFDWSPGTDEIADTSVAEQQTPPAADSDPDAGDWDLSSIVLAGTQQAALHIEGGVTDVSVISLIFEYRIDNGADPETATDWISSGDFSGSLTVVERDIASVELGTPYYASVRYMFVGGGVSGPLILGPVTTGAGTIPIASILDAVGGTGDASITVQAPQLSGWTDLILMRSTTSDFDDAIEAGAAFLPALYETVTRVDGGLVADTYWWWVVTRDGLGNEISRDGPVTATVT